VRHEREYVPPAKPRYTAFTGTARTLAGAPYFFLLRPCGSLKGASRSMRPCMAASAAGLLQGQICKRQGKCRSSGCNLCTYLSCMLGRSNA
jgi:hypothetical protein